MGGNPGKEAWTSTPHPRPAAHDPAAIPSAESRYSPAPRGTLGRMCGIARCFPANPRCSRGKVQGFRVRLGRRPPPNPGKQHNVHRGGEHAAPALQPTSYFTARMRGRGGNTRENPRQPGQVPRKTASRPQSGLLFRRAFFSAPLENGAVPQVWGQPPAIRGEATSPGPRKRPGRPPATPGRPDPGRVARGPRKHVTFAPRGGTFPIVLGIRRTPIASGTIKHVTFAKRDATFSIVSRIPGENDTIPR